MEMGRGVFLPVYPRGILLALKTDQDVDTPHKVILEPTSCTRSGDSDYSIRSHARIDYREVNLSARRAPKRVHFRIVECAKCGLIYSNPIYTEQKILDLYKESEFIDEQQLSNMLEDYLYQLKAAVSIVKKKGRLLEIGCGNGFFLKAALDLGFEDVCGVEPGRDAVSKAHPSVKDKIINDTFSAEIFDEKSFDLICVFQVMDHLLDPSEFLSDIHKILKDDGVILLINHNVRFILTRLLGSKSPMFDIEHIYLFDKLTIRKILEKNNFEIITISNTKNNYTLGYCLKMFPLPSFLKNILLKVSSALNLSDKTIKIPAGNMVSIARK